MVALFMVAKSRNNLNVRELMNKQNVTYPYMEYYLIIKRNEVVIYDIT